MVNRPKKGTAKKGFDAMTDREVCKVIEDAWKDYAGDCSVFMSAAGALMLGRAIGWQGVRLCMTANTYRKYEKILNVRFRDLLPQRCHDAYALAGIKMIDDIGQFWQSLSKGLVKASEARMVS